MSRPDRLTEALLETADDMRRVGILTAEEREKIALRHLDPKLLHASQPITGEEIRPRQVEAGPRPEIEILMHVLPPTRLR